MAEKITDERERKYIAWKKISPLIFYIITWFLCIKEEEEEEVEEKKEDFEFLFSLVSC